MRHHTHPTRRLRTLAAAAGILAVVAAGVATVVAQSGPNAESRAEETIEPLRSVQLLVGRSAIVEFGRPINRVSLTNPEIGDALVTGSSQLLLNGKAPGTTSMFVWDQGGLIHRYEIAVQRDLARLSQQLGVLFPGEAVQVHSNGRQIVLAGTVTSKLVIDRLLNVAAGYVESKDEVVPLLQVLEGPRSNQVLLRVRFAEVSRSALSELGLSLFTSGTGIGNTVGRLTTQQFEAPSFSGLQVDKESGTAGDRIANENGSLTFGDFLNVFLFNQRYDIGVLIRALQTRGLFESLAEPNLVAESGKSASFLAGGEFPVPIAQGSGANVGVSVQFKEFGVRLSFTPTVTDNRISLKVAPEVSVIDFGNAVLMGGFRIPALSTRRTETEVELADGQTFAIAGLLNSTMNTTMRRIPGFSEIPILGKLFQSKAAQRERTELVVLITPEILPADSPGVTSELPKLMSPFMPGIPPEKQIDPPPPAFQPAPPAAQ